MCYHHCYWTNNNCPLHFDLSVKNLIRQMLHSWLNMWGVFHFSPWDFECTRYFFVKAVKVFFFLLRCWCFFWVYPFEITWCLIKFFMQAGKSSLSALQWSAGQLHARQDNKCLDANWAETVEWSSMKLLWLDV